MNLFQPPTEEISELCAKWVELERRLASLFSRVRPGAPWWFWFECADGRFIHQVVQDGSGTLWVMKDGRGVPLFEWLISDRVKVLCAVRDWKR